MSKQLLLALGVVFCFLVWAWAVSQILAREGVDLSAVGSVLLAIVLTFLLGFVAGIQK